MRKIGLFVGLMGSVVVATAADPVQVLFPYSIAGRVINYDNVAYDASSGVTLSVRNAEGRVLAKSRVFTPGGVSAWNYRLDVPIATRAGGGYAAPGDTLSLTAVDAKGTVYSGLIAGDAAKVGKAGETAMVRVMLDDDKNANGIADVYEWSKEYDMWLAGVEGAFDPAADYDGDGVSNRDEYLAGTDPFDPNDFFRVRTTEGRTEVDGEVIALTFEANAGRSYEVRSQWRSRITSPITVASPNTTVVNAEFRFVRSRFRRRIDEFGKLNEEADRLSRCLQV